MNRKNDINDTAEQPAVKAHKAEANVTQHITAYVVGNMISQQLIDPLADDMPWLWDTVSEAVSRAFTSLDPLEVGRAMQTRQPLSTLSED